MNCVQLNVGGHLGEEWAIKVFMVYIKFYVHWYKMLFEVISN